MKNIIKGLTGKTFIIGILLLIQLIFIFMALNWLSNDKVIGVYVHLVFQIFSFFIVLKIIVSTENPTYKIAWLIPVLALPIFGTFFYIFYYSNNVRPKNRAMYLDIIKHRAELLKAHPNYIDTKEINYFNHNGWRDYKNTKSTFFPSGLDKLNALVKDLKKAEKFIFIEYFIISKGEMYNQIIDTLTKKSLEGVEVKIIYDDMGSSGKIPRRFIKKMNEFNIDVIRFNKISLHLNFAMNYRDHRKIVVIDNKVAYTGGVNIGDEYINLTAPFGHWSDVAVRIEGEAVWSMTLLFLENWNFSSKQKLDFNHYYHNYQVKGTGIYVPFGDNPLESEQVARNLYLYLIGQAKKEVLITTPYLILDNEIVTALKLAAQSGIDVKVIIPGIPDKKMVYQITKSFAYDLFEVGVKVYTYTPGFIHSKLLVVDEQKALVGTTNLDFRSLYLHFENNIFMHESESIKDIVRYINDDVIAVSKQCELEDLHIKSLTKRVIVAILRSFSSIL